jgi:cell wall assembly regulator SMI1
VQFGWRGSKPELNEGWRPVGDGWMSALLTNGGADEGQIKIVEAALGLDLPVGLRAFVGEADAAEGFVGGSYLAMWPIASLADLNMKARVPEFVPDLIVFATDGGGEGYAFERQTGSFVNVPMIGMRVVERTSIGDSFASFLSWLASRVSVENQPMPDDARLGQVVYEKTPIIVGGSPTDPANKVLVPLAKYAEIVGWWNERLPSRDAFVMPGPGMPPAAR